MGDIIELRELVKATLQDNVTDPFPASLTRTGDYFMTDADDINFKRKDTFPKGEIRVNQEATTISGFGNKGYTQHSATIDILYYCGKNDKYVDTITYKGKDLIRYILKDIQNVLLTNRSKDYYLTRTSFSEPFVNPELVTAGGFQYYMGAMSVVFYWSERIDGN